MPSCHCCKREPCLPHHQTVLKKVVERELHHKRLSITMAQGQVRNLKKKSAPSKAVSRRQNKATAKKGKRTIAPKRSMSHREEASVTKAINRKNETAIAAKAIGVGTQFFLKDIAGKGKAELDKQLRQRDKKQKKTNQTARHLDSLQKL